jgi:IclR family transcriptional regulator, acetate operon repressor
MSDAGGPPIESVDRALRLVEILRDEGTVSVTDAAERLGVAPSTAHRLLAALIHRRFAVQDKGQRRHYRAGPALAVPDVEAMTVGTLRVVLNPALEQLHQRAGETAQLLVPQGGNVRFVYGIEPEAPLRVATRVGDTMPAYCTSGGKALLAELDDAQLHRVYPDGLPPWPTARIADLDELARELVEVRHVGYGLNQEETEPGVCGLGVAVHDAIGSAVASLVVAVPSVRFRRADIPRYAEDLRVTAAFAEELLLGGWSPRRPPRTGPPAPTP